MLKFLWRTDVHLSDQTPSSRTDDWTETVCGKLEEVGEIARRHQCLAVLDGGDFFNDKTPIRTSHKVVARVAQIHQKYPCPTYVTVGNHDVRLAQLDNLNESPLEALFSAKVFHRLYDEHDLVLRQDGVSVRIVGVPYHGVRYDLDRFRRIQRGDEDWLVCVAHVLASPQGGEMFQNEDILRYSDLPELMPDVDAYFFGHWHKNQGITSIGDKWVINVGSLTRGSLTQDNVERTPGVVLASFGKTTCSFEFEPITIEPAKTIFDIQKRVKEEARAMTVNAFITSVKEELQSASDKSFEEILQTMDITERVKERALQYIEIHGKD